MLIAETFKALGDSVRLEMIRRLADGSPQTVGTLSDNLGLTRQGSRKHLQTLADAKLVSLRAVGRKTEVILEKDTLIAARSFIAELELRWDSRLHALQQFVEDGISKK